MKDFIVKIIAENGDVDIYTNATSVCIDDGRIEVAYDDNQRETHCLEVVDEILIRKN